MSTKGSTRENKDFDKKYVGFASVEVVAISPTRKELNTLLGTESENTDEINYIDQDKEGNDRVRLSFWLHDEKNGKYFVHNIWVSNLVAKSKDGLKTQFVNSACESLYWPDKDSLPEGFSNFMNKEKTERLGVKTVREALKGEGELCNFVRSWLGRLNFFKPDAEYTVDTKAILKGDFRDIRSDINGDFDAPFIVLIGVETDSSDPTKQYQKVFGKKFLPGNFMNFISSPASLAKNDYAKKLWDKFELEVRGEYGFQASFELVPLTVYDPSKDVSQSGTTKKEEVTQSNSKY